MKPKDASKAKYIIGNMVIPMTDEIEAVLRGNYCELNLEHIAKTYPEKVIFMEQSLIVTDFDGLDRWCKLTHPRRIADSDIENLSKKVEALIKAQMDNDVLLVNAGSLLREMGNTLTDILREQRVERALAPKPSLFQRIFKRKKR